MHNTNTYPAEAVRMAYDNGVAAERARVRAEIERLIAEWDQGTTGAGIRVVSDNLRSLLAWLDTEQECLK